MAKYLEIARRVLRERRASQVVTMPIAPGYITVRPVPPEMEARGLAIQAELDRAFSDLPSHLKDVQAIESAPFWEEDGAEMRRLLDAEDWPGLQDAMERHLKHGLDYYAERRRLSERPDRLDAL